MIMFKKKKNLLHFTMKIDRKVCYKFGKKFTLEDGKTAFYFKKNVNY